MSRLLYASRLPPCNNLHERKLQLHCQNGKVYALLSDHTRTKVSTRFPLTRTVAQLSSPSNAHRLLKQNQVSIQATTQNGTVQTYDKVRVCSFPCRLGGLGMNPTWMIRYILFASAVKLPISPFSQQFVRSADDDISPESAGYE